VKRHITPVNQPITKEEREVLSDNGMLSSAIETLPEDIQVPCEQSKPISACDRPNREEEGLGVVSEDKPKKWYCFGKYDGGDRPCITSWCDRREECRYINQNPIEETKDDLEGLVEPEPSWMPDFTVSSDPKWTPDAIEKLRDDLSKLETEEDDEQLLIEIGGWLKGIRERTIQRAGVRFDERMAQMMEEIAG